MDFLGRYEFKDEKSNKFWTIAKDGEMFVATFGKIGSTGQTHIYTTELEARKKAREKISKGYRLVQGLSGLNPPTAIIDEHIEEDDFNFMEELRKVK